MKRVLTQRTREQGSTLIVSLLTSIILGTALASYLILAETQYRSTVRSATWNRTIPVTEAGVEEALQLINTYAGTTTDPSAWTNNAPADGWTSVAPNVYYVERSVGQDHYDVYITNLNDAPIIKSLGTAAWTYPFAYAPQTMFAAAGVSTLPSPSIRAVLVTTKRAGPYFLGILAKKGITLSGGIVVDSFNSQDPNYSTNGQYDPAKSRDGGNIGTFESNVLAAVSGGGGAKVYGHVETGPGDTVNPGTSAWGEKAWVNGNNQGVEPGWWKNDLNVAIPDAPRPPSGTALAPMQDSYLIDGTNYAYYLPGGNYKQTGNFSLGDGQYMLVSGSVSFWCTGDFAVSGSGYIYIAPGASFTCYIGGNAAISGGGTVNGTGYATNCAYYGQTTCSTFTLSGGSEYIGIINAPQAAFTMSGGSAGQEFAGAVLANSVNISGGYLFHYDESLGGGAPSAGYYVTFWQEVEPK